LRDIVRRGSTLMEDHRVRLRLEKREESFSCYAARARASRGRELPEEKSPLRTDFQRDRDRILHTKAFRRLKHKTQVFIAPLGDHYVTRLTHTLEVTQIARTIARALNLNEDLVEAMALGHDLGHTPFGHAGEETLDRLASSGFRHNYQSLRIVDVLEKDGKGLNLTWEVRQGIVNHSKPRGDFLQKELSQGLTLEAQICRVADAVAYLNHDIGDAMRSGVLDQNALPDHIVRTLGSKHSERIDVMVSDIVDASWDCMGDSVESSASIAISMSSSVREALNDLREFMFQHVYMPMSETKQSKTAQDILVFLYNHFIVHPEDIPQEYSGRGALPEPMALDYIAGMTDQFAIRLAEDLYPGISNGVFVARL
jgi:dGTPase